VKNLKSSIMLVLVWLSMFIQIAPAQASPIASDGIGLDFPKERHVLETISLIYAPMDNHSDWLDAVCENMTEGGCSYFTDDPASMLWETGQDVALNSAWPLGVVATLDDGSQVWKAAVAIYKSCGDVALKDCPSIESDIYLHVVYDEAQDKWLLNRILYGPYIDFPKFEEQ
jgi:hypothetical protein